MDFMSELNHPLLAKIEQLEHLRTVEICPVVGTILELRIGEAKVLNDAHTFAGIKNVRALSVTDKSDVFSFTFCNFVSYSVTEEMFIQQAPTDNFQGNRIRIYSKSRFLDFVADTTWATSDFPGPLRHYQLITLDHIIDIVAAEPPTISMKHGQD